ncbi:ACS family glucarate transporter-like MFS transporter [Rhizobium sp. BK313]|uniref:MFS transporter n=1 Tax=Rhizobium sp. BK313 TaxID=2587081 RepID=UPI0010E3F60D|nr:MFS transporter [Rhizobium sp. BK313]MBB3459410.1 ACS family glucarate transporter-like MFS transporter [Rhizobium sp. BK313]
MVQFLRNHRRYFIYLSLLVFLGIYNLDRLTISIAGSTIAKEMNLGPVAMGYLFSSILWLYAVCLLPSGSAADRFGPRVTAAVAAAFWSLFQGLSGFATSATTLLITRLGNGGFEAAANPAAHATIRAWTPRRERGLATAIWFFGSVGVPGLGAPILAWIVTNWGWRASFIATGILGFIWVALWWAFYEPPEKAKWLEPAERDLILRERDFGTVAVDTGPGLGYKGLFAAPTMWGLALTQSCVNYTSYFFSAWLPTLLQQNYNLTVLQTGSYTAIAYIVSATTSLLLSYICDRLLSTDALRAGKRRYAVGIANIIAACVILVPFAGSLPMAMVLLTVAHSGNTFAQSMNFALVNDRLKSSGDVGRAFAIFTLGGVSAGMLAPIVTGYLVQATGTFDSAMALTGCIALIGTLLTLFMTRKPIGEPVLEKSPVLHPAQ